MYMVYTFKTRHTIKCVIIIFIWIQWNEAVMRHIIIRHWSWGKAPNIYIHNDFPHLAWGFTIYEKRALIWISSMSSWVPVLFSSVALSLSFDECTTMLTGSGLEEVWRGCWALSWPVVPIRARHPWIWDLGTAERERERQYYIFQRTFPTDGRLTPSSAKHFSSVSINLDKLCKFIDLTRYGSMTCSSMPWFLNGHVWLSVCVCGVYQRETESMRVCV